MPRRSFGGLPKDVRHINQNMLTATPSNDFDSAYVARGFLTISPEDLLAAGMRELKRQNILYSEQSMPLWTLDDKWKNDAATKAVESSPVVVRWLPMLIGSFLGWVGSSHEPEQASERTILRLRTTPPDDAPRGPDLTCIAAHLPSPHREWALRRAEYAPMGWPKPNRPTMHEDLGGWINRLRRAMQHEVRYATGFDIASPERTWYTPEGGRQVERIQRMTFEVAETNAGRWSPTSTSGRGIRRSRATRRPSPRLERASQESLRILYDEKTGLPAHYLCAENNVEQMLRAVLRVRRALSREGALADFDRYVRVRFGHVTHASVIQARQMAEAGVWADVNLTSNLATGALSFPSDDPSAVRAPRNPGLLKRAAELVTNDPLFDHHALVTLLACGVPTVLETDGGGIEHSDMAQGVRPGRSRPPDQRGAGGSRAVQPNTPARLGAELHSVFLDAVAGR